MRKFAYFTVSLFVLIIVVVLISHFVPERVYFYKTGTTIPVASHFIQLVYSPFCSESPCGVNDRIVYSGYTGSDGSILIPWQDASNISRYPSSYVGPDRYEYWVNTDDYKREYFDPKFRDSTIVYLKEVKGHKAYRLDQKGEIISQ